MTETLSAATGRPVSRETFDRIMAFVDLLRSEAAVQNLVSRSSLDDLWERHVVDCAQLVRFEPRDAAAWVDIGSGAGLPGILIALLVQGPVTLVEPRRLRADFLARTIRALDLQDRVTLHCASSGGVHGRFDVITARAVAPLPKLLGLAHHLSHPGTVWVLPKGKSAKSELAEAQRSWHCAARSEDSVTDPEAAILILAKVKARSKR